MFFRREAASSNQTLEWTRRTLAACRARSGAAPLSSTMSEKVNEKQQELIDVWETDLRIICHAHYDAAVRAEHRNYQLGIPVIVLSVIVGSAIFVSLKKDPSTYVRIIVGLLSLGSVVLALLQTFLKWSERAEKHREAGSKVWSIT